MGYLFFSFFLLQRGATFVALDTRPFFYSLYLYLFCIDHGFSKITIYFNSRIIEI